MSLRFSTVVATECTPVFVQAFLSGNMPAHLVRARIDSTFRVARYSRRPLAQLFRFTAAESRLAMALLAGAEAAEYATANGVSLATVRTQLRSLLAKTGTRRQAELVRLLGGVPGLNAP